MTKSAEEAVMRLVSRKLRRDKGFLIEAAIYVVALIVVWYCAERFVSLDILDRIILAILSVIGFFFGLFFRRFDKIRDQYKGITSERPQ